MTSTNIVRRDDWVALFPGQGAITPGAGEYWRHSPHWTVVTEISDAIRVDVNALLTTADEATIVRTDNAQVATFALSLVGWHTILERGWAPQYVLGHSLGEFSALVAAGVLSLSDGARVVAARGAAMADAARQNPGSMVALMGGDDGARDALAGVSGVWVANVNGTGQIVVSGSEVGLADLMNRHRELGWKRATPLTVGGAFHSPLMAPAQLALNEALSSVTWRPSDHTVIANVDGTVHHNPADWESLLRRQLTSPVEFLAATLTLPSSVQCTLELPPGNVLTGLTKRIRPFDRQVVLASETDLPEEAA